MSCKTNGGKHKKSKKHVEDRRYSHFLLGVPLLEEMFATTTFLMGFQDLSLSGKPKANHPSGSVFYVEKPPHCGWLRNPFAPRNETMVETITLVGNYRWGISKHRGFCMVVQEADFATIHSINYPGKR